jgi:hypothetical protein
MNAIKANARLAGALYVAMGVTAWFSLMYVPHAIIVRGDAAATARNIMASEFLFRLGIVSELLSQTIFLFLALTFYSLFKEVDRNQARTMVALVLVAVAIEFVNCLNLVAPLVLLSGAEYLAAFPKTQLDALALSFLRLRASGVSIVSVFWGLWLIPLGLLVMKSRFMPRALGILLMLAGLGYAGGSLLGVLYPAGASRYFSIVTQPLAALGELTTVAWLIFKGAHAPSSAPRPAVIAQATS